MAKKILCILFICLCFLGGCWDYRGLNEMAIVAGMAIDKSTENDGYEVTFELVDLTEDVKEKGPQSMLLVAEGKTLFDAARNAKKRILNKLYFGHMETIIISEQIAREENLSGLMDWFLRGTELRETMCIMVSQHETAKAILTADGLGTKVNSFELHHLALEDSEHTSSTSFIELYNIYNILQAEGKELTLPSVHNVKNEDIITSELNGTAVFKGERLVGLLSPEESKYFLFATGEVKSAILTIPWGETEEDNISLEVSKHMASMSYTYQDEAVKVKIKMDTHVTLNESAQPINSLDLPQVASIEYTADQKLIQGVKAVIKRVQEEYASDIFGFGSLISQQDAALWRKLKDQWDTLFPKIEVAVESKLRIVNTATIGQS